MLQSDHNGDLHHRKTQFKTILQGEWFEFMQQQKIGTTCQSKKIGCLIFFAYIRHKLV